MRSPSAVPGHCPPIPSRPTITPHTIVTLIAKDKDNGSSLAATKTITVTNVAPTAAINGAPLNSPEGTTINLNSTVTDPSTADVRCRLHLSVDCHEERQAHSGPSRRTPTPVFTPDDNATYVVTLVATDKDNASSMDTKAITVFNVAPSPTITGAPGKQPGRHGDQSQQHRRRSQHGRCRGRIHLHVGRSAKKTAWPTHSGSIHQSLSSQMTTQRILFNCWSATKTAPAVRRAKTIVVTNVNPTAFINGAPAAKSGRHTYSLDQFSHRSEPRRYGRRLRVRLEASRKNGTAYGAGGRPTPNFTFYARRQFNFRRHARGHR